MVSRDTCAGTQRLFGGVVVGASVRMLKGPSKSEVCSEQFHTWGCLRGFPTAVEYLGADMSLEVGLGSYKAGLSLAGSLQGGEFEGGEGSPL